MSRYPSTSIDFTAVRSFNSQAEASVYAARLTESGIHNYLLNGTVYSMLPVGEKGIRLFVAHRDVDEALELIKEMDYNDAHPPEETFHDADLDEILYQKELHQNSKSKWLMAIIIAMVSLILLYAVMLAANGLGLYHQ